MCEICRMFPCPSGCPNADEPKAVYVCDQCGEDILEGDYCYRIGDCIFCEACMEDFREEAVCDEVDEF